MTYRWTVQDETHSCLADHTIDALEAAQHADSMDRSPDYYRHRIDGAHLAWRRTYPDGAYITAALYRS